MKHFAQLHRCQQFPDSNNEYWIVVNSGVWKVKPKKGRELKVQILLIDFFGVDKYNQFPIA